MSGPEMTFVVHPRPVSDDPRLIVDSVPATVVAASETRLDPDDDDEGDTFLGNLAFLVKYAFGRH